MLRKLKWQITGEPLAARYKWCKGPVLSRGPAVEKHWYKAPKTQYFFLVILNICITLRWSLWIETFCKRSPTYQYEHLAVTDGLFLCLYCYNHNVMNRFKKKEKEREKGNSFCYPNFCSSNLMWFWPCIIVNMWK